MAFSYASSWDLATVTEAKASWRETAKAFWRQHASEEQQHKQTKLQRAKAFEWVVATTHMLLVAMGRTWSYFKVDAEPTKRKPVQSWPCLTLGVDQGSDGWSAAYVLIGWG